MYKAGNTCLALMVIAALILVPASAGAGMQSSAKEPSAGAMTADIVMARPIGLVSLILGSSLFVVSLPLSALGKNVGVAADKLVKEPAEYTFYRPLGEM